MRLPARAPLQGPGGRRVAPQRAAALGERSLTRRALSAPRAPQGGALAGGEGGNDVGAGFDSFTYRPYDPAGGSSKGLSRLGGGLAFGTAVAPPPAPGLPPRAGMPQRTASVDHIAHMAQTQAAYNSGFAAGRDASGAAGSVPPPTSTPPPFGAGLDGDGHLAGAFGSLALAEPPRAFSAAPGSGLAVPLPLPLGGGDEVYMRSGSAAPTAGSNGGLLVGPELLRTATPPLPPPTPASAAAAMPYGGVPNAMPMQQAPPPEAMGEVYQAAYMAAFYAQQQQMHAHFARQAALASQYGGMAGMQGMQMGMGAPGMGALAPLFNPPGAMAGMGGMAGGMSMGPMGPMAGQHAYAMGMGGMGGGMGQMHPGNALYGGGGMDALQQLQLAAMGFPGGMLPPGMAAAYGMPPGMRGDRGRGDRGRGGGSGARRGRSDQIDLSDLEARFGSVAECVGQVGALARDQHGCRFLQRKFDEEGSPAVELCFPEMLAEMVDLMVDPFGNYLVQKLLDCCSEEQRSDVLRAVAQPRGSTPIKPTTAHEADEGAAEAGAQPAGEDGAEAAEGGEAKAAPEAAAPEEEAPAAAAPRAASPPAPSDLDVPQLAPQEAATPGSPPAADASDDETRGGGRLSGLPALVGAALNTHGTRAVQKLVETLSTPEQVTLAVAALSPGVVILIKDLNGNHVVQRCLQRLAPEASQFIYDAAAAHCVEIATHRHGCCVLQRCIDHAAETQRKALVAEVAAQALILSQDPFGNYVVQYVLNLGLPWASALVMARLGGSYAELSTQKFSSNVVEKCLKLGEGPLEECRAAIVRELTASPALERLLQDPYGNYVIQSALSVTKGALHAELVERIRPHMAAIKSSPFGKRILARSNLLHRALK
jgi:hypothetical protein